MNTSSNKARLPRNVSLDNGHTAEYRVNIHGVKDNQPKNTLQEITDMLLETDLMIDNTTSEPRDILMTERTALSWVKFSITLATIAITIVTNFRLDTSGNNSGGGNDENSPPWLPKFSYGTAILFVLLKILEQYQLMATTLNDLKAKLEEINSQMAIADPENIPTLIQKAKELQGSMDSLGLVFKSTVHNLLLQVNSNQLVNAPTASVPTKASTTTIIESSKQDPTKYLDEFSNSVGSNGEQQIVTSEKETERKPGSDSNIEERTNNIDNAATTDNVGDDDVDEDVDLDSGIDEETMDAVDRIQHELAMSVDIHRQIADQLEINNPDDY
ncbi:hypothetical protein C6P42_005056 [Pichia californica]|nr:hypothetical protein C6P42_005056 [[Candida] californica]